MNATAARPPQRYRCRCPPFHELADLGRARPVVERICRSRQQRLPTTPGLLSLEAQP